LMWMDEVTEKPALGATEIWEIYNNTVDAHPIHLHQIAFQVINREDFTATADPDSGRMTGIQLSSVATGPRPHEVGFKDTVLNFPGQVTRIKARFDRPNLYVWHCHIVEHEDNEMMRPMFITMHPSLNLGAALGYSLLALDGAKVDMSGAKSGVFGDVGLAAHAIQNFSEGFITGSFFVDPLADNAVQKNVSITGGTVSRDLKQAASDARSAAAAASALLPTMILGNITEPQTLALKAGLNVIRMDSLHIGPGSLVLRGGVDDEVIFNISGGFTLSGRSSISLAGGLLPSRVLFNLQLGGPSIDLSAGSTVAGSILAPARNIGLSGGSSITGAVVSGSGIALTGGSTIRLVA